MTEENVKQTKKKKRRKKHPFLVLFIVVVFLILLTIFALSDFFTVTKIDVRGNHYYTEAQVREIAGITTGYNLFKTKTNDAKDILLSNPYIKLVKFKRIPRGTIRITVTEREEYACVPYGGQYIIIDETGLVLRVADNEPTLPVLEGMTIVDMTPGSPLKVEQTYLLTDTLELLKTVVDKGLYFKRIYFSTVVVKAYLYDMLYCEGTPDDMVSSMDALVTLVNELVADGRTRGVINVGADNYLSYSAQFEE